MPGYRALDQLCEPARTLTIDFRAGNDGSQRASARMSSVAANFSNERAEIVRRSRELLVFNDAPSCERSSAICMHYESSFLIEHCRHEIREAGLVEGIRVAAV